MPVSVKKRTRLGALAKVTAAAAVLATAGIGAATVVNTPEANAFPQWCYQGPGSICPGPWGPGYDPGFGRGFYGPRPPVLVGGGFFAGPPIGRPPCGCGW